MCQHFDARMMRITSGNPTYRHAVSTADATLHTHGAADCSINDDSSKLLSGMLLRQRLRLFKGARIELMYKMGA